MEQPTESQEFAWLIDECIHQRIAIIATTDQQLLELNSRKMQQRVQGILVQQQEDKAMRERLEKWLFWSFGNLHRTANKITFLYLFWTPLIVFWTAIITMSMPTTVGCPQSNSICQYTRVLAMEVKKMYLLPRILVDRLMGN